MHGVEVTTATIGGPKGPWLPPVAFQITEERITVRSIVERAVTEQVREVTAAIRLRDSAKSTVDDVTTAYLSPDEIADRRRRGSVRQGSRPPTSNEPSLEEAKAKALEALNDRRFVVVVDGVHHVDLDDEVKLKSNSQVEFLRLMPLVGG